MKRIPIRVNVQSVYSSSTPIGSSNPGTGGGGGGMGGSNIFQRSSSLIPVVVFRNETLEEEIQTTLPSYDFFDFANVDYESFMGAVTDYVSRPTVVASVWLETASPGSATIIAYDYSNTEIARSQPTTFTSANGYVVVRWIHGINLALDSVKYFDLRIDTTAADVTYIQRQPFFAFVGTNAGGTAGGGGNTSLADLRNLYLSLYTHGSTEVTVDGTSIQDAIDSMPETGGKILVKQSTTPYAAFNFNSKQFTSYCSVMAFPGHVPQVTGIGGDVFGNETAVLINGAQKVGIYGLDISSYNQSGHPYADAVVVSDSIEVAIWSNIMHDAVHGIGVNGAVGAGANHIDACYNRIYNCAGWLDTMASGISFYQLQNVGGGDGSDGYSCRIIGNIVWDCENDPSWGAAVTDGNGIIIDIANGAYSTSAINYLGTVLIANNICVGNGGRGIHSLFSRNVHEYFNTCASNLKSATMIYDGEITQIGSAEGGKTAYNIVQSDRDIWFGSNDSTVEEFGYNVVVGGTIPVIDGTNIDRTTTPDYFVSPSISTATVGGWTPRSSDRVAVDPAIKSLLQSWPDAAGRLRPTAGPWTIGAVETSIAGGGGVTPGSGTPTTPVAPIFHPEDFGAVGDGVTDDTAALQDCLDALGGGTMLLTPGKTYVHSDVLTVTSGNINGGGYRSGTSIVSCGIIHSITPSASAVKFTGDNTGAYGVIFSSNATVRGVTFEEQKVLLFLVDGVVLHEIGVEGSCAAGILMEGCTNYTIRSVVVKNTLADGIHNTGGSNNGLITDPYCENVGDDAFPVITYFGQDMCHDITWLRPVCRGTKARGIACVGANNIIYRDIDLQGTRGAGIYLASEPPYSYDTESTSNITIVGGVVRECNYDAALDHGSIFFWDANRGVSNCAISGLHVYDTGGISQFHITAFPGGSITGCSLTSVLVHAAERPYLVYDPGNVLTLSGVAYA